MSDTITENESTTTTKEVAAEVNEVKADKENDGEAAEKCDDKTKDNGEDSEKVGEKRDATGESGGGEEVPKKRVRKRKSGWDAPGANDSSSTPTPAVTPATTLGPIVTPGIVNPMAGMVGGQMLQQQAMMARQRAMQQMQMATMMQQQAMVVGNPMALMAAKQAMVGAQQQLMQAQVMAQKAAMAAAGGGMPGAGMAGMNPMMAMSVAQSNAMQVAAAVAPPKNMAARIYVGSLQYDIKKDDVVKLFEPFGEITEVDMSFDPLTQRSKGFCFVEYREVQSAENAIATMNQFQVAGRPIKVGRPTGYSGPMQVTPPSMNPMLQTQMAQAAAAASRLDMGGMMGGGGSGGMGMGGGGGAVGGGSSHHARRIYVGSVVFEINSEQLKAVFAAFGNVVSCELLPDTENPGRHRGYGFLEFETEQAAADAIQHMNNFDLAGRSLKVAPANSTGGGAAAAGVGGMSLAAVPIGVAGPGAAVAAAIASAQNYGGMAVPSAEAAAALTASTLPAAPAAATGPRVSRAMLLLNMVDVAEVDEDLAGEVEEEAGSHGKVERVEVHIVDGSVRIFVVFEREAGADKAVASLNNRYFGGRVVKARLYELEKLDKKEYTA